MAGSGFSNRGASPSAMGVVTRLAYARALQEGVEVNSLLKKAGLTRQQIDDPSTRLHVSSQIQFLELAAATLKDELLGFHLSQTFDLRLMGLLYYVLASSEVLEEALRRGARYSTLANEGIALGYYQGRNVGIRFEYVGVARHSDRHQIESLMVTSRSHLPTADQSALAAGSGKFHSQTRRRYLRVQNFLRPRCQVRCGSR